MTGQDGGFPQAAARFSAEVDAALTRARRAMREAREVSAEFRRDTEELATQAKTGKLRGVRRGAVTPTPAEPREHAMNFRSANGLPVEDDLPGADELIARLPAPEPPPKIDDEDFSQHRVLDDLADDTEVDERPAEADATLSGDAEEDFSQQRILPDSTVESNRPDGTLGGVFEPSEPENPSSEHSSRRQPEVDG